jgi:hypothetical protein
MLLVSPISTNTIRGDRQSSSPMQEGMSRMSHSVSSTVFDGHYLIPRELFRPIHPPDTLEKNLGPEQYKGVINPVEAAKVSVPH